MKSIDRYIEKYVLKGKIIGEVDTIKIKGGKIKRDHIWNGCGGIIPQ